MRSPLPAFALLFALSAPPALAQVSLHIDIGLPVAPPLVTIGPRIQVVEGFADEVFFSGGWYWCRRGDGWYRARRPRDRFAFVEVRRVPRELIVLPAGHYRHWHRQEHRMERRMERREDRREERREERREHRDHGPHGEHRGHGHD